MADIVNLMLGALMGIACLTTFALVCHKPDAKGDAGFVLFWGVWWLVILVVYALFHGAHAPDWVVQSIDMLGNASLFVAAYALHKGKDLKYYSPDVVAIFVATVILIVLCVLGGILGPQSSADWQVFAMAPSQVLATTAFILLGIAGGERFPDFRISIYVLCGIYGILQVPAYHALFIEGIEQGRSIATADSDFWKWCLAAGKIGFAICAAGVLGFVRTRYIKLISILLDFLSALLGAGIAILRFMAPIPHQ